MTLNTLRTSGILTPLTLLTSLTFLTALTSLAQVTCLPVFPNASDNVTITYDATQGNGALAGVSPVWAHLGVITNLSQNSSDWKHVATTWALNNAAAQMTSAGTNLWTKTFNITTFFNVPANETVLKLAFVFRDASGNTVGRAADGGDIFYEVYPDNSPLQTLLLQPTSSLFLANIGQPIPVKAASSAPANLRLLDNGAQIATAPNAELLQHTLNVSGAGLHKVDFIATTPTASDTSSFTYIVPGNIVSQDPPAGTEWGIHYLTNTSVRLALYAPGKQVVFALGDFNNWQPTAAHQMKRSLDGKLWWLDLEGISPGQPVRFQYLVDGNLKIADPLSTLVLDPWNDAFVPPFTFPNLPPYPAGLTSGMVSVLQTAQIPFNWTAANYERPKKTDLVVYELLMRDFLARHDYPTLLDTLDYLEKLGVTAIELMPVNEFDGNISWGYNPAFHKSLDKYYGSAIALKTVVDECHRRNIAVILDVVFNQATGASPLAQLYWDAANNRPAADNPWLNPTATHDFNVFNDFNHESQATKTYVKNCLEYWLSEFRVDGFRFDLSKGFTQNVTVGNVGLWGQYDASRVAIWKDYADFMWAIDPDCYVILEHFADNSEEKELAEYGMMLWGNMWGAYKETALGYSTTANLSGISYQSRGWAVPHLVGYMESHDEERIAYECKTYGNAVPNHNIKTVPVYTQRMAMLENLFFTVPGPKMLWQFGELAYDFPINYCEDGNIDPGCRTGPKPIRWDYLGDPDRHKLHDVTAALLQLRKNDEVFETSNFSMSPATGPIREINLYGASQNAKVIANIATSVQTTTPQWPIWGEWYEYYSGDTIQVPDFGQPLTFSLQPGEYRIYLDKFVALPPGLILSAAKEPLGAVTYFELQPNPVREVFVANFSLRETSGIQLEITDIAGQTIESQKFENLPAGEQRFQIESAHWQPGVYFAVLRDSTGAVMAKKLVKM
ncbi:MAG: alpha-amylase family glycosyl hydrolase [Saprospiraceae bacterium]